MVQIDALNAKRHLMLAYLGRANCDICKSMLPKLLTLLLKRPPVKGVKADLSTALGLAAGFSIFTVLAVILFVMGKETLREAGIISLTELEQGI